MLRRCSLWERSQRSRLSRHPAQLCQVIWNQRTKVKVSLVCPPLLFRLIMFWSNSHRSLILSKMYRPFGSGSQVPRPGKWATLFMRWSKSTWRRKSWDSRPNQSKKGRTCTGHKIARGWGCVSLWSSTTDVDFFPPIFYHVNRAVFITKYPPIN